MQFIGTLPPHDAVSGQNSFLAETPTTSIVKHDSGMLCGTSPYIRDVREEASLKT
jgi:hypothetical protein